MSTKGRRDMLVGGGGGNFAIILHYLKRVTHLAGRNFSLVPCYPHSFI